jgi:hypothetical protein
MLLCFLKNKPKHVSKAFCVSKWFSNSHIFRENIISYNVTLHRHNLQKNYPVELGQYFHHQFMVRIYTFLDIFGRAKSGLNWLFSFLGFVWLTKETK